MNETVQDPGWKPRENPLQGIASESLGRMVAGSDAQHQRSNVSQLVAERDQSQVALQTAHDAQQRLQGEWVAYHAAETGRLSQGHEVQQAALQQENGALRSELAAANDVTEQYRAVKRHHLSRALVFGALGVPVGVVLAWLLAGRS